ncbi:MAG TPA: biosynthetic peptidoglycan transglycosylase [Polyangiaceae bacterium]|nr:biosynthetic peptidoglycan transglycosylase [Polyangiaceae bacterium]
MVHGEAESGGWWTKALQLGRGSHRLWLIAGLVGLGLGIAAALALKPVVRHQARQAAQARGVLLAIGEVSIGWKSVTLSRVGVSLKDVDVLQSSLDRVRVELGWSFKPQAIEVVGGEVALNGSLDKIERQLTAWYAARPKASTTETASGAGLALDVVDVDLVWEQPGSKSPPTRLTGFSYSKSALGQERLGWKRAAVAYDRLVLSVSDASVVLDRNDGQRTLRELQAGDVSATLTLSENTDASPAPPVSPTPEPPLGAGTAGDARQSRLANLLPPLDAGRGPALRAAIATLAERARAKLPADSKITLDKLNVTLVHDQQKLHLGPNRFVLARHPQRLELGLAPGSRDQVSPLTFKLDVPFTKDPVNLRLSGGPVNLAALGVKDGDFSLRDAARSELAARGALALGAAGDTVSVETEGRLAPLSFENRSLSGQLLRGSSLSWSGKARAWMDGSRYEIERWELALGEVELALSGSVQKTPERVTAQLSGGIPLASCQALLESAPEGMLPLLAGMKLSGTFALDAAIDFDTSDLSKMRVTWDFKNECRVTEVPVELAPRRFLSPFRLQVKDVTGRIVSIETGPGTSSWTPYAGISPNMETAVLICEDGGFLRHDGFDRQAIENSIKENVKAGRFVRGASTISMQLAKNLYLSFDKTLSRKLQEAVLTTLLEQELSKEEMMELYLNVIEYGPGIYGITAAAEHYFKTTPAALSLGQALYLASILPNPANHHFTEAGPVSDGWHRYLQKLMRIAVKIGRISEAEYEAALEEEIRFGVPATGRAGGVFLPETPLLDPAAFGELPEAPAEGL